MNVHCKSHTAATQVTNKAKGLLVSFCFEKYPVKLYLFSRKLMISVKTYNLYIDILLIVLPIYKSKCIFIHSVLHFYT